MVKLKIATLKLEIKKKQEELGKYNHLLKYFKHFYKEEKFVYASTIILLAAVIILIIFSQLTDFGILKYIIIVTVMYAFVLWRIHDHHTNTREEIRKLEEELKHFLKHK